MHGPQQSSSSEQMQVADSKKAKASSPPRKAATNARPGLLQTMTVAFYSRAPAKSNPPLGKMRENLRA